MGLNFGTVQMKRKHGRLEIQSLGRTPRGQQFLRRSIPIDSKSPADPDFKPQLRQAVEAIFAEG